MWFKNLCLFRFQEPFTLSAQALATHLAEVPFRPCLSQELVSRGWMPPLGRRSVELVHSANGAMLICLQSEEKLLPSGVIKEALEEKALALEERENRRLRARERANLRDEVVFDLLPKAFSRHRRTYAYIDPRDGWLVIDSASAKTVGEFTERLRKALGKLPIVPPQTESAPASIMTHWLAQGEIPPDILPEDACELRAGTDGGVVRCRGQDLASDEIRAHLQAGKEITQLALTWADRITLVLNEDLLIRRLRFLDVVQEQLEDIHTTTEEELFDAQFTLMTAELRTFLPRLLALFS